MANTTYAKRNGETLYPGEKIETYTVGLTASQEQHVQAEVAKRNYRNPGAGWSRSRYIQWLIDQDMGRKQREEERRR
jgi:hypothetical protein